MSTRKSEKKSTTKKKNEGIIDNVINLAKTSVLAGLGIAFLGEEKLEQLAKKNIVDFIKDVKKQSVQARKDVEKRLRDTLKELSSSREEKSSESSKSKSAGKKKKKKARNRSKRTVNPIIKEKASEAVEQAKE